MLDVLTTPLKEMPLFLQLTMGFLVFMMGASLGSFLAAAIYRATTSKKSIAFARSECTTCQRKLTAIDLVPLFSFLLLGAKCRTCKSPISWRYFLIELSCATLTLFIVYGIGLSLPALFMIVSIMALITVLVIDFDLWLIPLALPIFLMFWGGLFAALSFSHVSVSESLIGLLAGFGSLALILVVSTFVLRKTGRLNKDEAAMGWGDPFLMGGIGAVLGYKFLPMVLFLASIQALLGYAVLKMTQRDFAGIAKEAHAEQDFTPPAQALPLGTFLSLAAIEMITLTAFL